jgi:dTDP-L-rhamnose 4-epimerase
MKVLVTGGAGFVGSHTVDALLAGGYDVKILDSFNPTIHDGRRPSYLAPEAEVIEGDVREKRSWETALQDVDAVFHLAAHQDLRLDFSTFFHVNAVGTALLYEVAVERRLPLERVVVGSSQAVLGEGRYCCTADGCPAEGVDVYPSLRPRTRLDRARWEHPCGSCASPLTPLPTRESEVNPRNQYALSKHAQECAAVELGRQYGIPTVALRYSIVQGARQSIHNTYSGVCRLFCLSHLAGAPFRIYEDGAQLRDFVAVADVVAANLLALEHPEASGRVFNVGGGRAYTVLEFAGIVQRRLDSGSGIDCRGEYRYGDTRHILSDISDLRRLGWNPLGSPGESVRDYATWLEREVVGRDAIDLAQPPVVSQAAGR